MLMLFRLMMFYCLCQKAVMNHRIVLCCMLGMVQTVPQPPDHCVVIKALSLNCNINSVCTNKAVNTVTIIVCQQGFTQ